MNQLQCLLLSQLQCLFRIDSQEVIEMGWNYKYIQIVMMKRITKCWV